MRKTIDVQTVLDKANRLLALPPSASHTPEWRKGVASLLEAVLMNTETYAGFNYLEWVNGGCTRWRENGEPGFPEKEQYFGDQTRRVYYSTPRLKA